MRFTRLGQTLLLFGIAMNCTQDAVLILVGLPISILGLIFAVYGFIKEK